MKSLACKVQTLNIKTTSISFQKYFDMKEYLALPFSKVERLPDFFGNKIHFIAWFDIKNSLKIF